MAYNPTTWREGQSPAISAANLNKLEQGVDAAHDLAEGRAPASHTHDAADIVSGVVASARLGTGTADSGTVLHGDGTWKTAPTGGAPGGALIVRTTSLATIPAGTTQGQLVGYRNSGMSAITVAGVSLAAGEWGVWGWFGTAWALLNRGASPIEPDPDPDPDPEPTLVTPTGPTWTDDTEAGGGTWTASQAGVVYSPASGTASPGQVVTVTATPATGYAFPAGATTTWTHTFPTAPDPDPSGPIVETFDRARALYGTTPDSGTTATWARALSFALGGGHDQGAVIVSDGAARRDPTWPGAGAALPVDTLDWEVTVGYDVTPSDSQVRASARGSSNWDSQTRSEMMAQAIVRAGGKVLFEPWLDAGTYRQYELGTTPHATGTLTLRVQGDQATVLINGAQVGGARTLTGPQLAGAIVGFGVYGDGAATDFEATAL